VATPDKFSTGVIVAMWRRSEEMCLK